MTSLFRPEVMEHQRRRLMGEVILVQPMTQTVMTAALTLFSVAGLAFVVAGTYAKTETVQGYVAPTGGLAQIYATHGGIVTEVPVHEGDYVEKGTPLVRLSLETAGANGTLGDKLKSETKSRIAETNRQIVAVDQRFDEEALRLRAHVVGIRSELSILEQRLSSEAETLKLMEQDVSRYAELQKTGDGTLLELNRRKQMALSETGTIHQLEQQREQRQGDLKDAESQSQALPTDRAEKLSQLRNSRSELEQSLAQLDINSAYVIPAPVAGRVASLQAEPGQAVISQTPLAALVPEGSGLEANLLVPSRSAGLIQVGQEVRIRVDAFPYQRFGVLTGHVSQISRASFRPGELLAPIEVKDTVYRVVVTFERTSVTAYGEDRPLTPGMTLTADVVTDKRHFIDWVLDPLRAIRTRAGMPE
jgi:membrane fusion protein